MAVDGRRVRHGVLFRSDQPLPGDLPPDLPSWPPATVIDLRSPSEHGEDHPFAAAGASVESVPLIAGPSARVSRLTSLAELYGLLLDHAAAALGEVVQLIATRPGPVLVHCAAGKDRTGVVVALVLRLLGIGAQEVLADYTATAAAMPGVLSRMAHRAAAGQRGVLPGSRAVPAEFLDAPASALTGILHRWDRHPGGVHGWARDRAGVPSSILVHLADRMLEPHP